MRHGDVSTTEASDRENPFHPSLVRQMIQESRPTGNNADGTNEHVNITNEGLVAAGEVLRLFVQEAYHRATIEAECEYEGVVDDSITTFNCDRGSKTGNQIRAIATAPIRADHITKIAAELLMDFSW
jgi:hypothetical protein